MAAFSFNEFYQRNRRVVIWVILFLLLWALRDFFASATLFEPVIKGWSVLMVAK